jgi:drug/metabolite transporter (DMT)-like permease
MSAPLLMLCATFLFATMGVCVKLASAHYSAGEIVLYRSLVGALFIAGLSRWRGGSLRTTMPAMHFWRSLTGVCSLALWFYAIGKLPLATAITLNYMSSVWMALFLIGGAVIATPLALRAAPAGGVSTAFGRPGAGRLGSARVDARLVATVLTGFAGVALVLQPTLERDQFQGALAGLTSGLTAAMAYLQVTALGRAGEPEYRVVFYFSLGGIVAGTLLTLIGGAHPHTVRGAALLLAIGVLATVAQMMMTRAYAIGRALSNASLQYLGIVFSFFYGVMIFDDPVTLMALAGMVLIVGAGLAATRLRQRTASTTAGPPSPTGDQ